MASAYFNTIRSTVITLWSGLKLTIKHFIAARHSRQPVGISDPVYFKQAEGIATLQYPHESIPVPDNGRYKLHNEIDDCIVCDKCAKICPVDCIEIDPIRSPDIFGYTSDGTGKRIYAAKFDIDMSKCCFCGLCTTVCPTECLTMTKTYDFSSFSVEDHIYEFANMTPLEILQRKQEFEEFSKAKEKSQLSTKTMPSRPKPSMPGSTPGAKPVFKPKMKSMPKKPNIKPKPPTPDNDHGDE